MPLGPNYPEDSHMWREGFKHRGKPPFRTEERTDEVSPGMKDHAGKVPVEAILRNFARALRAVCACAYTGATLNHYKLFSWLDDPRGYQGYRDAGFRHWLDDACGDDTDSHTGTRHEVAQVWNSLVALELKLREEERAAKCERETEAEGS